MLYPLACAFPKLSIAALYVRVFPSMGDTRRQYSRVGRRISLGIIAFLVVNAMAFFVASTVACVPPRAFWAYAAQMEKCVGFKLLGIWISFPHIVSDIVMLLVPQALVWRLQVSVQKKLGLTIIFYAGGK